VKRTQLYLDEDLWNALHTHARQQKTTISDLVRQAARERYLGKLDERREVMQAVVGIRNDHPRSLSAVEEVRSLRRGSRMAKLEQSDARPERKRSISK
jgi:ribbon-helix-helix CopG family protein